MKQEEIITLLQNPAAINFEQTKALHEVLREYPYFQAARAVRLKGLKNSNSLHYNRELKMTAAHTADRGVLFDFITSEEFNQNQIANSIKKQEQYQKSIEVFDTKEAGKQDENLSLDHALKMKVRESEQVFDPELFRKREEEKKTAEEIGLGKPLSFDRDENHSFSEWLKLASAKPVKRKKLTPEEEEAKNRKFELIEEFISKNPRITPSKTAKKANLAEEHLAAPEAMMTETLARVYLEQKNYKKAIQAYKILILKNPEKSGFFADQIRAIEKLQDNNS
jgi:tetratricopeptide (TPR) repeat protein